jgi:uncharacterized protein YciI
MNLPPLHRQIVVPASPEAAFRVFTDRIGTWWPVVSHSVHGAGSSTAFQDGRLVETGPDGETALWGTVLDWQPPRSFRMTWHPGRDAENASTVTVTFAPVGDDATLVTVRHEGWQSLDARKEYRNGWPTVLSALSTALPEPAPRAAEPADADAAATDTDAAPTDGEPIIVVLSHTPAPGVGDPFAHPGFAAHARFLAGLDKQGILVGAGPFPASGEGMTIVRVAGPAAAADLIRAAHFEDEAVTGGVLEVQARPWVVMMHGSSLA